MSTKINNLTPLNHDPIRTQIILEHAPFIKLITSQMITRLPAHIDQQDLFSAGIIGLLDAIAKYDPSRDNKFKTYAEFRIRGAILDELRGQDWLPRSAREVCKKEIQAQHALLQHLGRQPTDQEMATFLNIDVDQYLKKSSQTNLHLVKFEDISQIQPKNNAENFLLNESDNKWAQNPLTLLKNKNINALISKALNELPQKQRVILQMYYDKNLNLKEIGTLIALTESRVSQLHTAGIKKLQKKLKEILTV